MSVKMTKASGVRPRPIHGLSVNLRCVLLQVSTAICFENFKYHSTLIHGASIVELANNFTDVTLVSEDTY